MPPVIARTAREALADRRLYKYRSLADAEQLERLRDIILGNRIRFSKPSELNDPLEGKPVYGLGDWTSAEYRQKFADWAWNTQRRIAVPPPEADFRSWILDQPADNHRALVERVTAENQEELERKWRILSLSATATHDLMWSHYADGHRGVALVFDASIGEVARAYEVSYVEERETLDIIDQSVENILLRSLLTKRVRWSYEQEFRSIGTEDKEPSMLHLTAQYLDFPP